MRRDVLTVENIPFDVSDPEAGELAAPSFYEKWQDVIQPVLKYGALLLLFLLAYLLVFRPVSKRMKQRATDFVQRDPESSAQVLRVVDRERSRTTRSSR